VIAQVTSSICKGDFSAHVRSRAVVQQNAAQATARTGADELAIMGEVPQGLLDVPVREVMSHADERPGQLPCVRLGMQAVLRASVRTPHAPAWPAPLPPRELPRMQSRS
jgi:hypothetical protein